MPTNLTELVLYLGVRPTLYCKHPTPELNGERTFLRSTPDGLWFRRSDGEVAFLPARPRWVEFSPKGFSQTDLLGNTTRFTYV